MSELKRVVFLYEAGKELAEEGGFSVCRYGEIQTD